MNRIYDLIQYSTGGIISKVIVKSEKINITLFCMAADTDIGSHTSTKEGTVYVIEGKGIFVLEGRNIEMQKGVLIHMKANQQHSIQAEKDTSFLLTLVG